MRNKLAGLVKARAGKLNLARADLRVTEVAAEGLLPTPVHTAVYLAEVHAAVGDVDGALKALGSMGTQRDAHFQFHLRCSLTFVPLEDEPRFRALLVIPRPRRGAHC